MGSHGHRRRQHAHRPGVISARTPVSELAVGSPDAPITPRPPTAPRRSLDRCNSPCLSLKPVDNDKGASERR